jgi:flavorubredoxin
VRLEEGATVAAFLPQELTTGVWWIGDCFVFPARPGVRLQHAYTSAYLVSGTERSLVVDTGNPNDWDAINRHLDECLFEGAADVEWIFPTHAEVAHAGNTGRLLAKFPRAKLVADLRDHHLINPGLTDRFVQARVGDELDLGGRTFTFVDAIFRDLVSTIWGFDDKEGVLFCGDGLGFGHYHEAEHCGKLTEEIPDLPIQELTGEFMEAALYWTRLKSAAPHVERLKRLIDIELDVQLIAPAHGSPIIDPAVTVPAILDGIEAVAEKRRLT